MIGYRSGKTNQNVDCLSQVLIPTIAVLDLKIEDDWILDKFKDEHCAKLLKEIRNSKTKDSHRLSQTGELIDKKKAGCNS